MVLVCVSMSMNWIELRHGPVVRFTWRIVATKVCFSDFLILRHALDVELASYTKLHQETVKPDWTASERRRPGRVKRRQGRKQTSKAASSVLSYKEAERILCYDFYWF